MLGALPLAGQHPIIYEGARVRITWMEPADWLEGIVQIPSSVTLGIQTDDADEDTRIILDDRTRLEIHVGRYSDARPGAIVGGVLGATFSAAFGSDAFGNEGSFFATSQAAFAGGLVGIAAGVIVSVVGFGEDIWEDVPVRDGRVVFPPLESPPGSMRNVNLNQRVFWERFRINEAAFVAFFEEHREALDPIEGLFVRTDGFGRIGIARDSMLAGSRYVIINLEPPNTLTQPVFGQIIGGIIADPDAGSYIVTHIGDTSPRASRAAVVGDQLILERNDGGASHWERRAPTDEAEPQRNSASNHD